MGLNDLTSRQIEVLSLAKKGLSNEAIALMLRLSLSTINITLHNAYARMGTVLKRKRVRRTLAQVKDSKRNSRKRNSNTSKPSARRARKKA